MTVIEYQISNIIGIQRYNGIIVYVKVFVCLCKF